MPRHQRLVEGGVPYDDDVPGLPREGQIYVEMELPAGAVPPTVESRTVHLCRIVRVKQLGDLVGIGVELLERLQ